MITPKKPEAEEGVAVWDCIDFRPLREVVAGTQGRGEALLAMMKGIPTGCSAPVMDDWPPTQR